MYAVTFVRLFFFTLKQINVCRIITVYQNIICVGKQAEHILLHKERKIIWWGNKLLVSLKDH